jgi:putative transposase
LQRAYKFRLYPNLEQRTYFAKNFGAVRFVWNKMLAERKEHYEQTGEMLYNTPAKYKAEFPFLKEADSLALANVQLNLNKAYKAFFSKKAKFPRFKSRKRGDFSYQTNNQKSTVCIDNGKIKLPKIGFVKAKIHRALPSNSVIKTVTIRKTLSEKYYISVLVEYESQIPQVTPKAFLGLDFSMNKLFISSNNMCPNESEIKSFHKSEKKLARLQRAFARTSKTSRNHNKLRLKVARLHEHITNKRNDNLHKLSHNLVNKYDVIAVETLNLKAMSKRKKGKVFSYGKSISDNGWAKFVSILEYKLAWQGKSLVKVAWDYPSSQLCHVCGYKNVKTKDVRIRKWECPICHVSHDRDLNAAINIREEGKRIFLNSKEYRGKHGNLRLIERV